MKEKINYSFIIPHKNCPQLLSRCINSIPERDDVEIIVVDDNSDDDKRPSGLPPKAKVVLLDEYNSKGAGRARNMGIANATGKWLLFADADDYYEEGFLNILDKFSSRTDLDILFFSCRGVDSDTLEYHPCGNRVMSLINQYNGTTESLDLIKYKTNVPWCKMILRSYVMDYLFFFDEVRKGNDTKFSYLSSYFTNNIEVIKDKLYVYTDNKKGITHAQRSLKASLDVCVNQAKKRNFMFHIGLEGIIRPLPLYIILLSVLRHQGLSNFVRFINIYVFHHKKLFQSEYDYVNTLETIKIQQRLRKLVPE